MLLVKSPAAVERIELGAVPGRFPSLLGWAMRAPRDLVLVGGLVPLVADFGTTTTLADGRVHRVAYAFARSPVLSGKALPNLLVNPVAIGASQSRRPVVGSHPRDAGSGESR